jgi:hypothetical protein
MPKDTIIWIGAISAMFIIFAGVLAWTDRHAHSYPKRPDE